MDLRPFYRRPGTLTLFGFALWAAAYVWAVRATSASASLASILAGLAADLLLGGAALLLSLAVVSQFVLPVRRAYDRLSAFRRLIGYLLGERGPVMFIENGRPVEGHHDRRHGPGVLLVGQASAAVLRTDVAFTRAVGPGVVFTEPGERLAEALDLRRQQRRAPGDGELAPGVGSRALTRDGIPIAADLSVTFMLDPGHSGRPREGIHPALSPYEFDPESASRAVYGHAYDRSQDVPWTELPLRLLADLWREQVQARPLDAFIGGATVPAETLGQVREAIQARLIPPRDARATAGSGALSPEAEILRSRGVRILDIHVSGLHLPPQVQVERIRQWQESWSADRDPSLEQALALEESARRQGREAVAQGLVRGLTARLRAALAARRPPDLAGAASMAAQDALDLAQGADAPAGLDSLAPHLRAVVEDLGGDGPSPAREAGG